MAGLDQGAHANRQQRLQADDSIWRLVQLAHLLLRRMWGMVRGDHVQGALLEPGDDGIHIGLGPERRRHLVIAVEIAQAAIRQREVMRAGLAGDADAAGLAAADEVDAAGRRDMQDVQPAAGDLGQLDVAMNHDLLGRRRHAPQPQPHAFDPLVHHAALR